MLRVAFLCVVAAMAGFFTCPSTAASPDAKSAAGRASVSDSTTSGRAFGPFTTEEIRIFLAARKQAEKISDPMQRCLKYPNPPGSHWTSEGVMAYCRFRLQPVIDRAELKKLLDGGRAHEIDQRLSEWTGQPRAHPEALWRMMSEDFVKTAPDTREMLEAWKEQSPESAFAYAASGYYFLQMGWDARGQAAIQDTPQSNINEMEVLLARADGDLRRAIKLDPSLALPHAVMVEIGTLQGDDAYVSTATKQGLLATPPSLPLYESLARAAEPRWGGSRAAQDSLIAMGKANASMNPLLSIIQADIVADQMGVNCYCNSPLDDAGYRRILDQVSSRTALYGVGSSAFDNGNYAVALIYLSEASRFGIPDINGRLAKATALLSPMQSSVH